MVIGVPGDDIIYQHQFGKKGRPKDQFAENYVLVFKMYFGRNKTAANATTDFMCLRTATGKSQAIFAAFQLSYLVTGTCDIVRWSPESDALIGGKYGLADAISLAINGNGEIADV